MKRLRSWWHRSIGLFSRDQRDHEIAAELASHLQLHVDDNLRAGMTPEEARRQARLKLGGVEVAKQAYREQSSLPQVENFLQDLRFTFRQLRKNPGFALTAVLVLTLAVCANISILAFVDAALLKPLPYRNPERLLDVTESVASMMPRSDLSYFDYLDWKRLNKVFRSLDVYTSSGFLVEGRDGTEPVQAMRVSDGFFNTLGIQPALGRTFHAGEDRDGAPALVMLTYRSWQNRFGGQPDVVGKSIRLSHRPYLIIGVLPRQFHFAPAGASEFWTTIFQKSPCEKRRSCHNLWGIGRLNDGVTMAAALANVTSIAKQLEQQFPVSNKGQGASVAPLSKLISGDIRPILLALISGAGLLLLIACINVASLLLVRAESRRRELAVRSALGASAMRIGSQFVTESLVLAITGCGLGVLSASSMIQLLHRLVPANMKDTMPFLTDIGLTPRLWAYAGLISLAMAAFFALTPALHFSFSRMREGLSEGSRGSAGSGWRRLGSRLVALELAIAVMLLVAGALFGKSLYRLLHVELGFKPDRLATLAVAAPEDKYATPEQNLALARELVDQIQRVPGVQSAALTTVLPVSFNGNTDWIRVVGHPYHGEHNEVNGRDVSADYLKTIQAKLVRGRYFTDAEDAAQPRVVIINQKLARLYFPGEDPIGKQIGDTELSPNSLKQIIGIVEDIRDGGLDSDIWPTEYRPFNQGPDTFFSIIARTRSAPQQLLSVLSTTLHREHPGMGISDEVTMDDRINNSQSAYLHRSAAWLVGGFAVMALVLGVIGLYGVVAYSVGQRTREIGVRMALGAQRASVYRLILGESAWLGLVGIALGLIGSLSVAGFMRSLLFGVTSWDLPVLLGVSLALAISALLASFFPARRAASVNPVEALRAE